MACGDVPFETDWWDGEQYVFTPTEPLEYGTTYTVGFTENTAMDLSSNYLAASSWSFTTSSTADNVLPTLVSTTPADGATNVALDVVFQIEFSEHIDPASLEYGAIIATPNAGDGVMTWTNGGTTLQYDPFDPLLTNTTYNLVVADAAVRDYAGNPLAGWYSATFTTGTSLPTGGFSGTISGDPTSIDAADPEGAIVIAFGVDFLTWDWDEGQAPVGGINVVDQSGNYEIETLEDGTYWPVVVTDSNGDGEVALDWGDAFGIYGVDPGSPGEPEADFVAMSGGSVVTSIDFALYDHSAIWGEVSYVGTTYSENLQDYQYDLGVFDVSTYDPENPMPEYSTDNRNIVWDPDFLISELDRGLTDGTYYVGAYMDVDPGDGEGYNPDVDPVGFYEVDGKMASVTVETGRMRGTSSLPSETRSRSVPDG